MEKDKAKKILEKHLSFCRERLKDYETSPEPLYEALEMAIRALSSNLVYVPSPDWENAPKWAKEAILEYNWILRDESLTKKRIEESDVIIKTRRPKK